VRAPGNPTHDILLEVPGAPSMDPKTAEQVRETISKGASGFAAGFTTSDVRKTYEEFKNKGVEISDDLTERDYGTDFGIRDPFATPAHTAQRGPTPQGAQQKQAATRA